ncbi:AAA family ATPase [Kitasatospora sp. RG8]|nr:AAA family ATPase [Kitasatospora sp. RG8]
MIVATAEALAGAGPGGLLLLLGEPGVGKTALLAAAAARAEERGMQVVATAGAEYRARLSYSGLRQFLDAAAALHPALHPGEALARRTRPADPGGRPLRGVVPAFADPVGGRGAVDQRPAPQRSPCVGPGVGGRSGAAGVAPRPSRGRSRRGGCGAGGARGRRDRPPRRRSGRGGGAAARRRTHPGRSRTGPATGRGGVLRREHHR